jgi:hypothetical protein
MDCARCLGGNHSWQGDCHAADKPDELTSLHEYLFGHHARAILSAFRDGTWKIEYPGSISREAGLKFAGSFS